jgi:phosphoglycerate dehydrogenase-like enzyme
MGVWEHPVAGLHVPATWHESLAVQVTGVDPVHAPPWHDSPCVHALPSLHVVPFVAVGFEQAPVLVLHVPGTWHWSLAAHVTGFDPVQIPAWHASLCVHALPSLQVVPSEALGLEHAPVLVLHVPAT